MNVTRRTFGAGAAGLIAAMLAGCSNNGGSASVGSFQAIYVQIIIGKHGTADRGNPDSLFRHAHFIQQLGDKFMHDAMAATGTIVHIVVVHQHRLSINFIFRLNYIIDIHNGKVFLY